MDPSMQQKTDYMDPCMRQKTDYKDSCIGKAEGKTINKA